MKKKGVGQDLEFGRVGNTEDQTKWSVAARLRHHRRGHVTSPGFAGRERVESNNSVHRDLQRW